MATYLIYRMKCNTESTYKYWTLLDTDPIPTVCPSNTSHSIDSDSVVVVKTVSDNIVKIREESTQTGGNFMSELRKFTAATGPAVVTSQDYSWPIPLTVMTLQFVSESGHRDDNVELMVGPDTIIGILTANADTGATGIFVNSTVVAYTMTGYWLNLFDGVNLHDCGRVLNIDKNTNKIGIENALSCSFSAASPTYVRQSVKVVNNFIFGPGANYVLGEKKIGGSHIPKDLTVRVKYTNNSSNPKELFVKIEYLY